MAHTLKLCFSDASSGWRKSADVKRAGQRCAITGSDYLSEDAYAGGSESSPESYDDTDNYYVTAPFSRSRHCSATAELQQSLTTSASFSTHALSGSQLSGDDTNNVNSTSMVSSLGLSNEATIASSQTSSDVYDQLISSATLSDCDTGDNGTTQAIIPLTNCEKNEGLGDLKHLYSPSSRAIADLSPTRAQHGRRLGSSNYPSSERKISRCKIPTRIETSGPLTAKSSSAPSSPARRSSSASRQSWSSGIRHFTGMPGLLPQSKLPTMTVSKTDQHELKRTY